MGRNILQIHEPFPEQALVFTCMHYKSFENTSGKGEIARNEQFLLFPQCFLSVWGTFFHLHLTSVCRLQTLSVWKSLKFIVWERVRIKPLFTFHRVRPYIYTTNIYIKYIHVARVEALPYSYDMKTS